MTSPEPETKSIPPEKNLADLIDRLEKATGPDRRLDAAICVAARVGPPGLGRWAYDNFPTWRVREDDDRVEVVNKDGTGGPHFRVPHYTRSIDAALTLVPEGWRPQSLNWNDYKIGAYLRNIHLRLTTGGIDDPAIRYGAGDTAPIALCIAALRARAAVKSHEASK